MKIKPEERVSKTPLTGEQARSQAEETAIEAVVKSAQERTRGIENLESRVGQSFESIVESQFSDDDRNVFGCYAFHNSLYSRCAIVVRIYFHC